MFQKLRHAIHVAHAHVREAAKRVTRSPKWRHVEKEHLRANPHCLACGSTKHPQVHHVQPFHKHPELELDATNLATFCMGEHECHLRIAHGGSFRAWNPNVIADAARARATQAQAARAVVEADAKKARLT